jgi:subfamily B ATP-binding cassette protein MsbA
MVVFIWYLGKMYKPMQELSKMTDAYSKAAVGYERIREVLETDTDLKDLPGARPAPRFKGQIEFEKVTFAYDKEQPILKDVSFRIEPGQVAALVGRTGAGKSSIVGLVPRFYDPTSGIVKIDGVDVRKYTQKSIREQVSFVLQETLLFHAPVWKNIAYGRPNATRSEILRAAEQANASEFIDKMPQHYDTMVGERGVTLSGGQRQRIAIARAMIRDTPILILDEPGTGLDAESENLVFEALERLMKGKTSIVIAHRLATIQRSDVIFVIEEGVITQTGSHDELLKTEGLYAELFKLQSLPEDALQSP